MNILGKAVQRRLSADTLRFASVENFLTRQRKLRARPDVVHEAGNLVVAFATFNSPR